MADLLPHSPADIVRRALIARGDASDPPAVTWPLYANREPTYPDNCLTLYDTQGFDNGRIMVSGERMERRGLQLRIRSETAKVGYIKASALRNAFSAIYDASVTIEGTNYRVHAVSVSNNILYLGRDWNSARFLHTLNVLAILKTV